MAKIFVCCNLAPMTSHQAIPFGPQPEPTQLALRLAILITCHNRRETTLSCLAALFAQEGVPEGVDFQIFLVDDGSTDGTRGAIRERFPSVRTLQGDGACYWAGGMRMAWEAAAMEGADVYLWLNDDTHLDRDALAKLIQYHHDLRLNEHPGILVGSSRDPVTGTLTYGGHRQDSKWKPFDLRLIPPGDAPIRCDTFNGNCIWVPQNVVAQIGRFGGEYQHAMADTDYGFRARKHGLPSWVIPGTVATCILNIEPAPWKAPGLCLVNRWQKISAPKGLPPRMWMLLCFRHGGWLGPLLAIWPYFALLLPTKSQK